MKKILILLILSILVFPAISYAAEFKTNEIVSFTSAVQDDLYTAGNSIRVEAPIEGDVFAAGQEIRVTEKVSGDITILGETITINGEASDDVRAAGRLIRLHTTVGDDLFIAGQDIELSDTVVKGSVYAAGKNIIISGIVEGSVYVAGERVEIKPGTHIKGDVISYGNNTPVIDSSVVIDGQKQHHQQEVGAPRSSRTILSSWLRGVATWFVIGLILLYLFPLFSTGIINSTLPRFSRALLTGAIWLLLFIPASIILLISTIGIPVAIFLITTTISIIIVACAYTALCIGSWSLQRLNKNSGAISWSHVLLGAVLYQTIWFIPLIGPLFITLATITLVGMLVLSFWKLLRHPV